MELQNIKRDYFSKFTRMEADNILQSGSSVLQVMQNRTGVTVQDGTVLIRGSDKITV